MLVHWPTRSKPVLVIVVAYLSELLQQNPTDWVDYKGQMFDFPLCLHRVERLRTLSGASFSRALILIHESSALTP